MRPYLTVKKNADSCRKKSDEKESLNLVKECGKKEIKNYRKKNLDAKKIDKRKKLKEMATICISDDEDESTSDSQEKMVKIKKVPPIDSFAVEKQEKKNFIEENLLSAVSTLRKNLEDLHEKDVSDGEEYFELIKEKFVLLEEEKKEEALLIAFNIIHGYQIK